MMIAVPIADDDLKQALVGMMLQEMDELGYAILFIKCRNDDNKLHFHVIFRWQTIFVRMHIKLPKQFGCAQLT